jgi:hypothetical protein
VFLPINISYFLEEFCRHKQKIKSHLNYGGHKNRVKILDLSHGKSEVYLIAQNFFYIVIEM